MPQIEQHVCPAHDAQSDFSGLLGGEINLLQGVLVDVDDVVQKVDGFLDGDGQLIPVHRASVFVAAQHVRQVDGA